MSMNRPQMLFPRKPLPRAKTAYLLIALAIPLSLRSQIISTSAGDSTWGRVLDVTLDNAGNQYVSDYDNHVIYRVDRLGASTIVAGTKGSAGFAGDGGLATSAKLYNPVGVAVDAAGNLYIAEYTNHRIRRVGVNGIINTIAGTGQRGFSGDGGPAVSAQIYAPVDLTLDAAGNLYIADYGNARIRKIAPNGTISTVAGSGRRGFSGDGGPPLVAEINPGYLTVAADGSIYFGDDGDLGSGGNHRVRRISANGTVVTTIAGNGTSGYSGDGGPAVAAQLRTADGVALDASGNVYISEFSGARIRKVTPGGIITTYAGTGLAGYTGDGGPATAARLNAPAGLAVDSSGTLYICDAGNHRVRKVTAATLEITTVSPAFMGKSGFSSNSYLEVYGFNLASTARIWGSSDFNGANAPVALDNVSVTVNGKAAFVYYVSPTQINVITPDDTAVGPVTIQVKNDSGLSNAYLASRAKVSPTLHAVAQFAAGGKQYVVAQRSDFGAFIGNPNLVPGLSFVTGRPSDTVIIYALGCGPTNPATQAGIVNTQMAALASPLQVRIGGVNAEVIFAGMLPNTIGLYQFNIVIPNVAAGDQPIELIVDGVNNSQNLWISVGG